MARDQWSLGDRCSMHDFHLKPECLAGCTVCEYDSLGEQKEHRVFDWGILFAVGRGRVFRTAVWRRFWMLKPLVPASKERISGGLV